MRSFPENVQPLKACGKFRFDCHPQVSCFTECCRELELALTPYDALRLKQGLGISSKELLDQYAIVEFEKDDNYPNVFLGMVDDGRASCPFVGKSGCKVYADRPGACRAYPVGRGAFKNDQGVQQTYILVHEEHCHGFDEDKNQTIKTWQDDQGIVDYNSINDLLLPIFNHNFFTSGKRLNTQQADKFILALYNLDTFRENIMAGSLQLELEHNVLPEDDTELLKLATAWLESVLNESDQ